MKKIILASVLTAISVFGANAQKITNDDYKIQIKQEESQKETTEDESFGFVELVYYSFEAGKNYGLSFVNINPKGVSMEYGFRANFEKYGNYNADFGVNYSFQLWGEDNKNLFLTAAIGPSFRMQDVPEYDSKGKLKSETKYKFDLFGNARLTFKIDHFTLSAGYCLWGAEFKLSKGYEADGFRLALGYSF